MARSKHPEETINRILESASKLFVTKGYEQTSIQDILNDLGNLSKGAIYHHFKSKEEILITMFDKISESAEAEYLKISKNPNNNGLEKLRLLIKSSVLHENQNVFMKAIPSMFENPRLLAIQLESSLTEVVPRFVLPLIKEGIKDGSITTDYPEELAEASIILLNIWLSPYTFQVTPEKLKRKYLFMDQLLKSQGVDIFSDEIFDRLNNLQELYLSTH